jgi:hypothetical protein
MKRHAFGWTALAVLVLSAALAVAYAAPGTDAPKAPATGCQMSCCGGGSACPCQCGCADGKPCTCGKDCACKCGCTDGKPCACGADKMAAGGCPMMRGRMAPDMTPVKVNAESEKLWKQLGDLADQRHQKVWELFTLQGADKVDDSAVRAKLAQIAEIDRQMSVARGGLYQYRVQKMGAGMGCGMGGGMGQGRMMGATGGCGMGAGSMKGAGAGCCGGCGAAK